MRIERSFTLDAGPARSGNLAAAAEWAARGRSLGLFATPEDAEIYAEEMTAMVDLGLGRLVAAPGWRDLSQNDDPLAAAAAATGPAGLWLPAGHPQAATFIAQGAAAARRAAAQEAGEAAMARLEDAIAGALRDWRGPAGGATDPVANPALAAALRMALAAGLPEGLALQILDLARQGLGPLATPAPAAPSLRLALAFGTGAEVDPAWSALARAAWAAPGAGALFAGPDDGAAASLDLALLAEGAGLRLDRLVQAARLWALTLAILAEDDGRSGLGLGLANISGLLLRLGLAHDSAGGRATAAAVAAAVTGVAATVSAEVAGILGARTGDFVLSGPAVFADCPDPALAALARSALAEAQALIAAHGLRHRSLTTLGPAPGPGRPAGADPFGPLVWSGAADDRPDRSVDPGVALALARLGYAPAQAARIIRHATGHGSLRDCPAINAESLTGHGFGAAEIARIEAAAAEAGELRYIFNQWVLGEDFCARALGLPPAKMADPGFDLLAHLGFGQAEIAAANIHVCGARDIASAPELRPGDRAVFRGGAAIPAAARLAMLAAIQPWITGAATGEVILPQSVTVAEVEAVFRRGQSLGLGALFLRRAGPGACDPLALPLLPEAPEPAPPEPRRRPLPNRHGGYVQRARVGGQPVELRTGEYPGGGLGEIFLDLQRGEPGRDSLLRCFASAVSIGLQHGVPLEEFTAAFINTRFAPSGRVTGHGEITEASSIPDFIFRELGMSYLGRVESGATDPLGALGALVPEVGRQLSGGEEDQGPATGP